MFFARLLVLLFIASGIEAGIDSWDDFKSDYNKSYETQADEELRRSVFESNLNSIVAHNIKYELGETTFKAGLNHLADKTLKDILETHKLNETMKEIVNKELDAINLIPLEFFGLNLSDEELNLPSAIDWRERGAVTRVKDQRECGSCYAFATVGALESQLFLKTGKLIELSEQEIVDCARNYGTVNCYGGFPPTVYGYFKDKGGVSRAADYPFEGKAGECRVNENKVKIAVKGFGTISGFANGLFDETLILTLANVGPVAASVPVSLDSFIRYSSGIYSESRCERTNHTVLLVGYSIGNGTDYWIIKNSWGRTWGEDGYMRLSMKKENGCRVGGLPTYPIIELI